MCSRWGVTLTVLLLNQIQRFHSERDASRETVTCRTSDMLLSVSKHHLQSALHLYVQDRRGIYHSVRDLAGQCLYDLSETPGFLILRVSYSSCHVHRKDGVYVLLVVIKELLNEGTLEVFKKVPMMCSVTRPSDAPGAAGEAGYAGLPLSPKYCTKTGFNIVIAQNATVPPLDLRSLQVEGNLSVSCSPKRCSAQSVVFQFPFTSCGAQSQVRGGNITFWVNIVAEKALLSRQGSVFREAPFRLTVSCTYALFNTNSSTSVTIEDPKTTTVSPLKNEGVLRAQIRFATDSSFRSFYKSRERPTMHILGEPVFVEIFVLKREDRDLVLMLHDCWATPTADPQDKHRWNLLHEGCPQQGTDYSVEVLEVRPGDGVKYPKLHKWLKIKMFSFVETKDIFGSVFLHCDADVCRGAQCPGTCNRKRRQSGVRWDVKERLVLQRYVVFGGPLLLTV